MRRSILLPIIAVFVGLSGYFGWDSLTAHSVAAPAVHNQVVTKAKTTPTPSPSVTPTATVTPTIAASTTAAAPTATATTKATAVVGNSLSIPSIGLNASLVDVGLTTKNAIAVPSSTSKAGRWSGGGWPGGQGSVVFVTGHVQGVFSKLKNLAVGQIVTVKYNDQVFNYQVVAKETVPLKGIDMTKPLSIYGGASEGLNMMTCAGTYNWLNGTYSHRLTVYTVRV